MGFSLSSLAGPISAGIDYFSAKDTQQKQKDVAREQMEFQERMSNTAYQRAVKDMRAANLNPALAYSQGGASAPGGAQPNLVTPQVGDKLMKGQQVSSAVQLQRAQTGNTQAQTVLTDAQTTTAREVARREKAEADLREQEARFAKKYPDTYNAWKLGGAKAAAADTVVSGAKSAYEWAKDAWKDLRFKVPQYKGVEWPKITPPSGRRVRRGTRR